MLLWFSARLARGRRAPVVAEKTQKERKKEKAQARGIRRRSSCVSPLWAQGKSAPASLCTVSRWEHAAGRFRSVSWRGVQRELRSCVVASARLSVLHRHHRLLYAALEARYRNSFVPCSGALTSVAPPRSVSVGLDASVGEVLGCHSQSSTDESPLVTEKLKGNGTDVSERADGVCVCVCGGGRLGNTTNPFISLVYGREPPLFCKPLLLLPVHLACCCASHKQTGESL